MRGIMKNIEKWRLGNCKTAFAYFWLFFGPIKSSLILKTLLIN
jgi:hypothetical protein